MSWLGVNLNESLSSIKGQISNFTKEVLADDDEEDITPYHHNAIADGNSSFTSDIGCEIEQYKQQIDQLMKEKKLLEKTLKISEEEKNERISRLQNELRTAITEAQSVQSQDEWAWNVGNKEDSSENDTPIEGYKKNQEEIFNLRHQLKELTEAQTENQNRNVEIRTALEEEISSLKNDVTNIEEEKKRLLSSLEELDTQNKEAVEQMLLKKNQLNDELTSTKTSLLKYEDEISSLKNILEIKDSQLEEFNNKIQVILQESKDKIQQLETKIESLNTENEDLKSGKRENEEQSALLEHYKASFEEKANLAANLQTSIENIANKLTISEREKKELTEFYNAKTDELNELYNTKSKEWSELEATLKVQEKRCKELMQQVLKSEEESKTVIENLENKLIYKDEENLRLEAVIEEKCSEQSSLFYRMKRSEENVENIKKTLKEEIDDLQKENKDLKSKTEDNEKVSFNDVVEKLKQNYDFQNTEDIPRLWMDLSSEVASLRCERDKLHEDYNTTVQELRAAQDLLEAVEIEKSDFERECEDLRDQLEELQCGERPPPEGSITPRPLPTIEEEEAEPTTEEKPESEPSERVEKGRMSSGGVREKRDAGADGYSSSSELDAKIQAMEDEIIQLKTKNVYREDQIDQLNTGIGLIQEVFGFKDLDLRQTYVSIRQEYTSLLSKIDSKESEREELMKLNSELEIDKHLNNMRMAETEREFEAKLERSQKNLEESVRSLNELHKENGKLQSTIETLGNENKMRYEEILVEKNELSFKIKNHVKEFQSLLSAKDEIALSLNTQLEENEKLKTKLLEVSSQSYVSTSELQNHNFELKEQLKEKENAILELTKEYETMKNNLQENKENVQLFQSLQSDKSLLETDLFNIKNEYELLKEKFAKLSTTSKAKEEELQASLSDIKSLNEKHCQFSSEIATLQQERQEMIATSTQKHQESLAYYAEIQKLTQYIEQEKIRTENDKQKLQENIVKANESLQKAAVTSQDADVTKLQLRRIQEELSLERDAVKQLTESISMLQDELKVVQKERDHLKMANSSFNNQYETKSKELLALQEKERNSLQECLRLKNHLKHIEEENTKEALKAEQREASLKQSIAKLHEKMASHSTFYSSNNLKSAALLESLQEEVRDLTHERDEARQRLSVAEETSHQQQESLSRLQRVLQDFQKTQSRDIAAATEREKRKLKEETQKVSDLQTEIVRLKNAMTEVETKVKSADALKSELQTKEDTIVALKTQVNSIQIATKKTQEQISLLQTASDGKVDKPLLRNLLVGYFATPSDKRKEVLRIIAEVLDFSTEERMRSGLDLQSDSWLSSIANFLAPPPSNIRVTSKVDVLDHSSLSQAFIRFLEEETSPQPQAKLPAIQMAEEANTKAEKKLNAKNALRTKSPSPELIASSAGSSGTLLSATIPSTLPTFQPVTIPLPPSEKVQDSLSMSSKEENSSTSKYLSSLLSTSKEGGT